VGGEPPTVKHGPQLSGLELYFKVNK
jgi:hypothetical protein